MAKDEDEKAIIIGDGDDHDFAIIFFELTTSRFIFWVILEFVIGIGLTLVFRKHSPELYNIEVLWIVVCFGWILPWVIVPALWFFGTFYWIIHIDTAHYDHDMWHFHPITLLLKTPLYLIVNGSRQITKWKKNYLVNFLSNEITTPTASEKEMVGFFMPTQQLFNKHHAKIQV